MKKTITPALILLLAMGVSMSSCKKEDSATPSPTPANQSAATDPSNISKCHSANPPNTGPPSQTCGTAITAALVSGQSTVGSVTVVNDANNLYVTYVASGNRSLSEVHLYVGAFSSVPKSQGAPDEDQFPYSANFNRSQDQFTFTIPLSGLPSCFYIFAEADVKVNNCSAQKAWGAGTAFTVTTGSTNSNYGYGSNGNGRNCNNNQHGGYGSNCGNNNNTCHATYFQACKQTCTTTCIYQANFLFNGENAWPNGATTVVVGGYTYTQSGLSTISYAASSDSKNALLAVATLKIYGNTISPPPSVTAASTVVENWLRSLGQLTDDSRFTAPANVATALSTLQVWELSQACP